MCIREHNVSSLVVLVPGQCSMWWSEPVPCTVGADVLMCRVSGAAHIRR